MNPSTSATMQAGVLQAPSVIRIDTRPIPEAGRGEVRIRLKMAGICGSDVSIFQGHRPDLVLPLVIGHEGLGFVDQIGDDVTGLAVGDRVVIEPNFPCGQCSFCWEGRGNICPNKRIFGVRETGCFAEYAIVPARFAWKIPDTIADDDAVMIEPTAVALHTLYSSPARPGDTIAVVGLGAIGLLVCQLAVRMGYSVLAYDRLPEKVAVAASLGASPMDVASSVTEIARQWQQGQVHTVFECAGAAPAFTLAVEAAPRGAAVVVAGLADKPSSISEFMITRQGIQISTSLIYDHPADFRRTIRLIESGFIKPSLLISTRKPFQHLPEALTLACSGSQTKVVLAF